MEIELLAKAEAQCWRGIEPLSALDWRWRGKNFFAPMLSGAGRLFWREQNFANEDREGIGGCRRGFVGDFPQVENFFLREITARGGQSELFGC